MYAPRTTPRPACPAQVARGAAEDVDAVLALHVATGTPEQWRADLGDDVDLPDRELVVARVGAELVGCARLVHVAPGPEDTAPAGVYVTGLLVAPAWRRHGVAAALVEQACALARPVSEVLWSFYDEDDLASADLHSCLGFRVVWRGDIGFPGLAAGSRHVLVQRLL